MPDRPLRAAIDHLRLALRERRLLRDQRGQLDLLAGPGAGPPPRPAPSVPPDARAGAPRPDAGSGGSSQR